MKVLIQQIRNRCTNSARAVRRIHHAVLGAMLVATIGGGLTESAAAVVQQAAELVPRAVAPSPLVVEAMKATWLTDEERAEMRLRHGTWGPEDLESMPTSKSAAAMIIGRWDLVADDPTAAIADRVEAMRRLGRSVEALALLDTLDPGDGMTAVSLELRAALLLSLGRSEEALQAATAAIGAAKIESPPSLAGRLAGIDAMRIRLQAGGGRPDDFQTMLDDLGDVRTSVDRLDAAPRLLEGRLLIERASAAEGVPALHEALALDPRRAEAWFELGLLAVRGFDFDSAERAAGTLDRLSGLLSPDDQGLQAAHPLATLIRARSALTRNDPDLAVELLDELLAEQPRMPDAIALRAATAAVRYDQSDGADWLARLDEVEPGSPFGWYEVGSALSFDRQYGEAAMALSEAIRRRPAWAAPHVELGLLEMQSGRDGAARAALNIATELDPYNTRAAFSEFLLEEIEAFKVLESEHFILKYRDGEDAVVANGMLGPLEEMHADLVARFKHTPDQKTVIELMPDHQFFAVRITGMPAIHTIAACTGPLIAIEVPREGPPTKHLGLFDWLKVLRHEYAHTITLSQTRNRIPHWLTEAAAVSIEGVPRKYETTRQLAERWRRHDLFDLDEINWAFVRPKRPSDRSFAYAQGDWMVEFMNERWGDDALVELISLYFDGVQEKDAIPRALGISRADFHRDFVAWAGEQVKAWGLDPEPSLDVLADRVRMRDAAQLERLEDARRVRLERIAALVAGEIGRPLRPGESPEEIRTAGAGWPDLERPPVEIDDEALRELIAEFPDHPDLLELTIRRTLRNDENVSDEVRSMLERYAEVRPVDPYPHRVLARDLLESDQPAMAIPHLRELDLRSEKDNSFALEIARLSREVGSKEEAQTAAERAVRMNPYHAANRELAAACAVELGDLDSARRHIEALVILEPDQPRHSKRLEAVERLIARKG